MKTRKTLLEDVAYGIYDRPGPTGKVADAEEETTVPDEVPLDPSPQMSNQLSVQRPPIEDEDYIPASVEELSRAAAAIAQLVPSNALEHYYKNLHKILDDATDYSAQKTAPHEDRLGKDTEEPAVTEESIRAELRAMLLEQLSDDDLRDYEEFRSGYSTFEPDSEPEEVKSSGEMSLDDMAKKFGYSGAPGMRQEIDRLTNRLQYFAAKVDTDDLDALVKYATGEFIDQLEATNVLDEEDVDDLRAAPNLVKDLDSFRYFFVSAFVMPAYRQVVRQATKKVKSEIQSLGIPKELHQTVFNQVTGAAARKPQVVLKKLEALSKAGKIEADEIQTIAEKIQDARRELVAMATDYSDDFVEIALSKWQSSSKGAKASALKKAMDTTQQEM